MSRNVMLGLLVGSVLAGCGPEAAVDEQPELGVVQSAVVDCAALRTDRSSFPTRTRQAVQNEALKYVNFYFTPTAMNLSTGQTCIAYQYTSPRYVAGSTYAGFPYKHAGYDSINVWNSCFTKAHPCFPTTKRYQAGDYGGNNLGRGTGVLGVDCAGFISKAFWATDNDYVAPSNLHNSLTAKTNSLSSAKMSDILERNGSNYHVMLVRSTNVTAGTVTVLEAGKAGCCLASGSTNNGDRTQMTTYNFSQLVSNGFKLYVANSISDK